MLKLSSVRSVPAFEDQLTSICCACVCSLSHSRLFVTPLTVAHQVPLSLGFSKREYWTGLPFPPPEDLPDSEIEPISPALAGGFFITEPPGKPLSACCVQSIGIISVDSALEQNYSLIG